jgi:ribosomal-protein-alanine N-acetyltransferase
MPEIRPGTAADLDAVAAIQAAIPEAAQWNAADYLDHDFLVAMVGNCVAGFAVLHRIAANERELLNLAVHAAFRRKGLARALLEAALRDFRGSVFLEVRESNAAAIAFYKSLRFQVLSVRQNYYQYPLEAAIVMKFHSC